MFANVMWASDGSDDADRALPLALGIAHENQAKLHIVHVEETLSSSMVAGPAMCVAEDEIEAKIRRQAVAASTGQAERVTLHLPIGNAGQIAARIADVARRNDVDLIVIGTRGHSALVGAILGSVTQALLHSASCPVLAVPPAMSVSSVDTLDAVTAAPPAGGPRPQPAANIHA